MRDTMKREVRSIIKNEIEDLKRFYIDPMNKRLESADRKANCMRGYHGSPRVNGNQVCCEYCNVALGEISPIVAGVDKATKKLK